jgi:hypothetical protein
MRNVKVIQHIQGKEHITDKLQTKSLEFTYEFIGIRLFSKKKKNSVTFDSKPPSAHDWHKQHAIYLTRLKTQYLKDWSWDTHKTCKVLFCLLNLSTQSLDLYIEQSSLASFMQIFRK